MAEELKIEEINEMIEPVSAVIRRGLSIDKMQRIMTIIRKNQPQTGPAPGTGESKKVEDLQIASDGSVRTYIENAPYPIRFFTPHESVYLTDMYKKIVSIPLKNSKILGIVGFYLNRKSTLEWMRYFLDNSTILLKEEHWSQPVKEIRRVLKGYDETIIDVVSIILENDMAYRYRLQDIVGEINKSNAPIKEFRRLLDIIISREKDGCGRMWKRVSKYWWVFLPFKKKIKEFLQNINIDEVKLSVEDSYWVKLNKSYNWGGGENGIIK